MITSVAQRWRHGRDAYRPAGEPIDTRAYEVAAIGQDRVAKDFVCREHYSGSYPAARFRFGLYRRADLVGIAVFSQPCRDAVVTSVFPCPPADAADLGRFVLLDDVPANGETWFLGRCFELLRKELAGVVSFSDPLPRQRADGVVVKPGHIGTIYQAANACYLGRSRPDSLRLLPDGRAFPNRALQKIRQGHRGWRYSAELLIAHGAEPPGAGQRLSSWVERWLPRVTRTVRHPGNHKYAWALDKTLRRRLPVSMRYPKVATGQLQLSLAGRAA